MDRVQCLGEQPGLHIVRLDLDAGDRRDTLLAVNSQTLVAAEDLIGVVQRTDDQWQHHTKSADAGGQTP